MTSPGYAPRHGFQAREILAGARQQAATPAAPGPAPLVRPERPQLTPEDRRALSEAITAGGLCRCCAGVHAGGELACPRLSTFEIDADGKLKAGSYWPDFHWDTSRVIFAEEATAAEEASDGKP